MKKNFWNFVFSPLFVLFVVFPNAFAALSDFDRQEISFENLLGKYNGGFESGKANWTASGGTFTAVTSGTNLLFGKGSFTWDASASGQTLTSQAVTIPKGYYGQNCEAEIVAQVPSGSATHYVEAYDGSNVVGRSTIVSSTAPRKNTVTFPCPGSGTIALRVYANADEPLIAGDLGYLGLSRNVGVADLITAVESYSPSFNSTTGHSASNGWYYRKGDRAVIGGSVLWNGTGAATTFTVTTPSVCSIDATKLNDTASIGSIRNRIGTWSWYDDSGSLSINPQWVRANTASSFLLVDGSNTVTSNIFANNDRLAWEIDVPCVGWLPSLTVNNNQQRLPKITRYTSGSGTHMTTPGTTYMRIRMVGGGGGGGSSGTGSFGSSTAGGNTTFGTSLLTANGGGAGGQSGNAPGGTATISSPAVGTAVEGQNGQGPSYTNATGGGSFGIVGGQGGQTPFGGSGAGGAYATPGQTGKTNSGSGGGGAGSPTSINGNYSGGGGAAGGFIDAQIDAPLASYAYAVGAGGTGGTAGTSGFAGGNGAAGVIEVTEFFGYTTAILANSVSTGVTNGVRIEAASIDNTGTATVVRQTGSWVTSVSRTGAGVVEVNYSASTWSVAPMCVLTINAATLIARVESITTTRLTTRMITSAGVSTDNPFYVVCMGLR